ncbi:glycosyltransferase BC10 [Mercurialis annua]|uniref:glycosyltransferase BC10 n=1 Tax=Mercurialis annua TaxID=3986 RepID=UPI0021603F79|nr:glycosyltransferase BC10 [Mercurialis annua]
MKKNTQNQNLITSYVKQCKTKFQFINTLQFFFLFCCGLTTGLILSSYLKNISFNLLITHVSFLDNNSVAKYNNNDAIKIALPRVGLREYLKVDDDAKHDMEDEELLWRASMAPIIDEFPFERVPKVAFLFLTKGPVLMGPLWEKFFKGHQGFYSVYVHSDPSYNQSQPESPIFHGRRIPSKEVKWGNVNMIEAERRLLANALLDISNQRFVLLSESCIPLFNFSTIYSYLINSTENYVQAYDLDNPVGRGRYNYHMSPEITINQWRKGSQWFEMDRKLAIEVVSDRKYFPIFQKYCHGNCYADEHYLPTFVSIKHWEKNSNRSLTWVDWSRGGPHPTRFIRNEVTFEFLKKMRSTSGCLYNGSRSSSCYLFARKFLPTALGRLLRFAPKVMHFSR